MNVNFWKILNDWLDFIPSFGPRALHSAPFRKRELSMLSMVCLRRGQRTHYDDEHKHELRGEIFVSRVLPIRGWKTGA